MICINKTATATTVVSESNTAKTVGSGNLDVFATPMMVALMEQAACECLASDLEPQQTSVGTLVNVTHIAASAIGTEITASAKIVKVDGRKVCFDIHAFDGTSEIGSGTHERFIIDAERFMQKLKQQ